MQRPRTYLLHALAAHQRKASASACLGAPLHPTESLSPSTPSIPSRAGSVARFVNHSCDPNLVVQPVLVEGGSALKYKLALVACR